MQRRQNTRPCSSCGMTASPSMSVRHRAGTVSHPCSRCWTGTIDTAWVDARYGRVGAELRLATLSAALRAIGGSKPHWPGFAQNSGRVGIRALEPIARRCSTTRPCGEPCGDLGQDFGKQHPRFWPTPVWPKEQVTESIPKPIADPALKQVPGPVMLKMTALAPSPEIPVSAASGIMIDVRGSENDARGVLAGHVIQVRPACRTAAAIAPGCEPRVEPAPIRKTPEVHAMRAPAALALPARALEPNAPAALRPVSRIERAQFGTDGHGFVKHTRVVVVQAFWMNATQRSSSASASCTTPPSTRTGSLLRSRER
jgi:hypothetical protein